MLRVKTFDATGLATAGRIYAGDLNAIQDAAAALSDFTQVISLAAVKIGETNLQLLHYGTLEARVSGALRTDGILRGLGGLFPGTFTTSARDAIASGKRPYGLVIMNTTTNRLEQNLGSDATPDWQPLGTAGGISATIIDAKGDLIVGSAADTAVRKAVGVDGRFLKSDSAQTDGLNWALITESDLSLTNGSTVNDATSARHGFLPILPSASPTTKFLRGDGSWQVPTFTASGTGRLIKVTVFDPAISGITVGDILSLTLQTATRELMVDLIGPGGGAGNAAWTSGKTAAGGGGGGGAWTRKFYDATHGVVGGMTLYLKLGVPGVGGAADTVAQNGTPGGDTKFDLGSDGSEAGAQLGTVIKAFGGGGGSGCAVHASGDVSIVDGGARGAPQTPDDDGTMIAASGFPGGAGIIISNSDGTAAKAMGGTGGASPWGGPTKGRYDSGSDAQPGTSYGGGGGGAASSESGPARKGGDGGPPVIVVYEYS